MSDIVHSFAVVISNIQRKYVCAVDLGQHNFRISGAKAGGDTDTTKDYEYTNWDRVNAYAAQLAAAS